MLRILTLNLQHGLPGAGAAGTPLAGALIEDPAAARKALEAVAAEIAELEPDIVALEEADLGQARSGRIDEAAVLAEALGWEHHRFAAAYAGPVTGLRRRPIRSELASHRDDALGPARALLGLPPAGFGNALLTRLPVSGWAVLRLGRGPAEIQLRGKNRLDPRSYYVGTPTARNMLVARIEVEPGSADAERLGLTGLSAAVAHLATRTDVAAAQLAAAWRALGTLPGPHLLAGDFNLRSPQVAALGIAREVGTGNTYPASRPDHRIDHVLTDPWPTGADGAPVLGPDAALAPAWAGEGRPLLRAVASGTHVFPVSDHAGTWVDLEPAG